MQNILQEPLADYITQKSKPFQDNDLAVKLRHDFPKEIENIIVDKSRYKVVGSPGKGNWTDCPWIAILDLLITKSPQSGYYPVFLFQSDMSGVYLSLNQGITQVKEDYKREANKVLKLRAEDYRAKLDLNYANFITKIDLKSKSTLARFYEAGNIMAKYYDKNNLPSDSQLRTDIHDFLNYYEELTYLDSTFNNDESIVGFENKQIRLHLRVERNTTLAKRVKVIKGYVCEACGFDFVKVYGDLGKDFIEAHHLTPISTIDIGKFKVNLDSDFVVLCSNCHSMIHKLLDPSDIEKLKKIIKQTGANTVYKP